MKTSKIGISLVFVLVPLMLLILPIPPNKGKWGVHEQDFILVAALVIAALPAVAYFIPNPLLPRRSAWALILLGASLLLSANIVWNKKYRDYVRDNPTYRREVFRRAMALTLHWPMYGRYDNAVARYDPETKTYSYTTVPYVALSVAIVAAWFIWAARRPLEKPWGPASFAILIGFVIATTLAFALCETNPSRLYLYISGYGEFAKDIHRFDGVRGTLRNYVELMPTLEWYGQHYPPGNLMLMQTAAFVGVRWLSKAAVILITAMTVVPLYALAREFELPRRAASAAILLFAASTSILILPTINTTPMLLFPATMCLWMLVRGLKFGSPLVGALLGVFYFGYLMFSFSASILGLLMALLTLLAWWRGATITRNVIITGAVSLATVLGLIVLTYLTTRFNLIACFFAAVRGHHEQQGNRGFDDVHRYLLRSTGNIIAYLTSTVPVCILAFAAIASKSASVMQRSLFIALAATILLAGVSGLFYLETERIWILFTPALAVAAGYDAARRAEEEDGPNFVRLALLLVLIVSCTQEFWFMHYR